LKATEGSSSAPEGVAPRPRIPNPNVVSGPRAIILCPTHELSRQITTYAKALCHNVKLRIVCASNPNARGGSSKSGSWDATISSEGTIPGFGGRPVDILIGTPTTVLGLIGGKDLGDRKAISAVRRLDQEGEDEVGARLSLERLEWLVIDEADVMFDRSFIETTQAILEDATTQNRQAEASHLQANLILSSATIPLSLSKYLDTHFPRIVRLASPRVHRLPKRLKTEYVQLTDGNKNATVFKKIEAVWAEDAQARQAGRGTQKGKIVIFANETKAARRLADYLNQKGVESLVMVGDAEERRKGSNKHLAGFLSPVAMSSATRATQEGPDGHGGPRLNIRCVSVYAFAIENFKRPEEEVTALMDLAKNKLIEMTQKGELLDRNGVRVNIIGRREMLPHDVQQVAKRVEDMTRHHTKAERLTINLPIALNGGVMDLPSEDIDEDEIEKHLEMTARSSPPLDVLIRTSGTYRLSDYMLWQACENTQLYFTSTYWPDFGLRDFVPILLAYQKRVWASASSSLPSHSS
ncbi:cis-prenyltransferase, partial [Tulasnella sp. 417]